MSLQDINQQNFINSRLQNQTHAQCKETLGKPRVALHCEAKQNQVQIELKLCAYVQLRSKYAPMPVEYVPAWHWMHVKEPDAPVTTYSFRLVKENQCEII